MAAELVSTRDPYPFEKYDNDSKFRGGCSTQKKPFDITKTEAAQQEGPWEKLYNQKTLSSVRHEWFHHEPTAPNDKLDFAMKSVYDNHRHLFGVNPEARNQKETVGLPHNVVLKNKPQEVSASKRSKIGFKSYTDPEKHSVHQIRGAIDGCHSQATNPGYSRTTDGRYFTK